MSNFLKNNQKTNIRVTISDDIILYEPTNEQKVEIKDIILSQVEQTDGVNIEGNINYDVIRYVIRECVRDGGFIDEYTDDDIEQEFENGNIKIIKLEHEIIQLIDEILQEFQYKIFNLYKDINSILNILNSNVEESKMYEKINKMFKKQKMNVKVEDLLKEKDNPTKIKKMLENASKK